MVLNWGKGQFKENKFSRDDGETLLIVSKDDMMMGHISHTKVRESLTTREIVYQIFNLGDRNKGVATEALKLISQYLFKTYLINRLELRIEERNLASEKCAKNANFLKESIARGAYYLNGKFVNLCIYSLLRQDLNFENIFQITDKC